MWMACVTRLALASLALLATAIAQDDFDYASRGAKKFGDRCEITSQCGFPGSVCDPGKRICQCTSDLPVTNHIDKCGREATVNETCFFNEQCEVTNFQTECRDGRCICRFEMTANFKADGTTECIARNDPPNSLQYIDPAMIGILAGMALMFVIICVVLRLFSRARWRENRTIFNTPNPRLMNVSLLRDSKLLHGGERRGSRAPSRAPSLASLRPHSPAGNQVRLDGNFWDELEGLSRAKIFGRRGSRASSNASAGSTRSNKSPNLPENNHNHKSPVVESVTIEVQDAKA